MTKKIILCLLIGVLSVSSATFAHAAETGTETVVSSQTSEKKSTSMTIDKAIEYAMEHSSKIAADKAAVKYYEALMAQAKSLKYQYGTQPALSDEMYLIKSGYRLSEVQMALNNAERTLESTEYSTRSSVYQYFYTYLSGVEKEKIAKTSLEQAEITLEQAKAKYKNGLISANDVTNFEIALQSAKNTLASQQRTNDATMETLKYTIGYPLDDELILTGKLEIPSDTVGLSYEEVLKNVREKNPTILTIKENMSLADTMMETYSAWYPSNTFNYAIQKTSYDKGVIENQNSIDQILLSVRPLYNSLCSAQEGLALAEYSIEQVSAKLTAVSAKFDMNMATSSEYINALQSKTETETGLIDAKLGIMLADRAYRSMYDRTN